MPRNVSKDDRLVDPVALLGEPAGDPEACPSGHPVPSAARFCPECGAPVVSEPPAGPAPAGADGRPKPDYLLTQAERAERERQHLAAMRAGRADVPVQYEPVCTGQTVLIHFITDGFTFAGTVWYRGQELELDMGSERYQQAKGWIHLTGENEWLQEDRYGKVFFRAGPWRGRRYVDGAGAFEQLASRSKDGPPVTGPGADELARADAAERARRRGVPAVPVR